MPDNDPCPCCGAPGWDGLCGDCHEANRHATATERAIYEYAQDDDAYPSTLSGRIANWFSWHVIESIPVLRRRFLERESS